MLRLLAMLLLFAGSARAADTVSFGLDWRAEAEYGGYYQAVATGIYARHGLEVSLRQGGPQLNQTQLLLAGRLDLALCSNGALLLNSVREGLPLRSVAAMFQKDPSVLLAHPGQGNDSLAALKGKPIMIGADTRVGWWQFLQARFGYTEAQIRPYTFNLAPFLADPAAIQQGYLGSEPFAIEQQAGFKPVVLLLSDAGFDGYASLLCATTATIERKSDIVQRFVDASIEGWVSYLHGDPALGNALIKADNPEMTDALLHYGRQMLLEHGIVESGDTATLGIGAMTAPRWGSFLRSMSQQGLYPPDLDLSRAYTPQFVNKGVGVTARPQ